MNRLSFLLIFLFLSHPAAAQDSAPAAQRIIISHAIAMYDEPKYPADFAHFDYVNPDAPKGGELRQAGVGTYDSFNGFIVKGNGADLSGLYETLMKSSLDEPFTLYGLLAETVEYPEDRSWIIFNLRPEARWHDGVPITADDVVWTFNFLITKGHPQFAFYYQSVASVEKLSERSVKFTFVPGDNRELPLIAGQLPVLPKHYWTAEGRDPGETTLEPPLGSGPYRVGDFEPGRFVEMVRAENYWGADLPVNQGINNFDKLRIIYVRDRLVAREMLKAGDIDVYAETQAKAWALDYDIPAVTDGRLIKKKFDDFSSGGMQGFFFNTRRAVFQDRRVRQALTYALDFEWMNANFFFGEYVRPTSYFFPTELGAQGLPTPEELAILEPYRGRIPDEVFTQAFVPPSTDGKGWPRDNLTKAFALLKEAGWEVRDLKLVNVTSGQQMSFEILLYDPAFERIGLSFKKNLEKLGIDARLRVLTDVSQYVERTENLDFDMIVDTIPQGLSPGNEQRGYWTTESADQPGTANTAGIKDPVIDELVDLLIAAPTRKDLVARTRALDRVLLWGFYAIPQWDAPFTRYVYWNKFAYPDVIPLKGVAIGTWWLDKDLEAALQSGGTP